MLWQSRQINNNKLESALTLEAILEVDPVVAVYPGSHSSLRKPSICLYIWYAVWHRRASNSLKPQGMTSTSVELRHWRKFWTYLGIFLDQEFSSAN